MIARESGLSRKSIDRYFADRKDCVIRVAEWILKNLRAETGEHFPASVFTDGEHTGAGLLRLYMQDIKQLFVQEPRFFVLYMEFKMFIYRKCPDHEQGYTLLWNWMGNRDLRHKIYQLGQKDGTLALSEDVETEEEYFCESFFGFLSNLAMSFHQHSLEESLHQIDLRIENTIKLYTPADEKACSA